MTLPRFSAIECIGMYRWLFPVPNHNHNSVRFNFVKSRGGSRINFRVQRNFTKKYITIRCVKSKGFFCRLFWLKLHRNRDIMVLAWVSKLSKQKAMFKKLLSFCLYSLLHGFIKTFIESFTRFAFVQYKHTFYGHLKDINLLFK